MIQIANKTIKTANLGLALLCLIMWYIQGTEIWFKFMITLLLLAIYFKD